MAHNTSYVNPADNENCVQVKQEPETDINGQLALTEGNGIQESEEEIDLLRCREELYAGHVVKKELVIGPEVLQHPDAAVTPEIFKGAQYHAVLQADSKGAENKKRMKLDTKMEDDNDREWEGDKEHKVAIMETENIESVEMGVMGKLSDQYLDPVQHSHIAESSDSVEDNTINDERNKNTHCSHNECKYQAVTSETLNQELRLHETIRYFVCDSCGLTLHSKQHLVKHINLCQTKNNDALDILKSKYSHINHMTHHKVHSKVKHKLSNDSFLKKRFSKHSGKELYFCAHCQYSCNQRSNIKVHLKTHTGKKPYTCTYCEYSCSCASRLKRHERTHTGEKPYSCSYCPRSFSEGNHLKVHIRKHTGKKPFICTYCEYRSSNEGNLKVHLRTHTGEKPYTCTHCNFSCSQHYGLKLHIRKHTDEKPYICTHCDYSCRRKSSLQIHLRKHTGEKPYTCTYCECSFSKRDHLNVHIRRHTGEKPYTCTYCDYICRQKSALKVHLRKHTDEKPFSCTQCNYSCRQRDHLKRHMRKHTGGES